MVIFPLDAMKESLKEKETKKSKEIVEVLQHASYYRKKRTGNYKIGIMKFLA